MEESREAKVVKSSKDVKKIPPPVNKLKKTFDKRRITDDSSLTSVNIKV